jgi:hypothetical protein
MNWMGGMDSGMDIDFRRNEGLGRYNSGHGFLSEYQTFRDKLGTFLSELQHKEAKMLVTLCELLLLLMPSSRRPN